MQVAEAKPQSLQDTYSGPGSHQPQEGSTEDHGDEPAQHAPGPAAPSRTCHRLRFILRQGLGLEEPLPGSRGPGPAEFQFQLQLDGSGEPVCCCPASQRDLGNSQLRPGLAPPDPLFRLAPPPWWRPLVNARQLELQDPLVTAGSRRAPFSTHRACAVT